MKLNRMKKTMMTITFFLIALLGMSGIVNAQRNRRDNRRDRRVEKRDDRRDRRRDRRIETRRRNRDRRQNRRDRYRVYRNGRYYYTNQRGVASLRRAVNYGYRQGYRAGRNDRLRRNRYYYYNESGYRLGSYGYQNYVAIGQYRYYFQAGYQRGYEDGYYSRSRYGSNGVNVLGSILSAILRISQY